MSVQYVYIKTEPKLWTVGFYRPDGKWEPESDHRAAEQAAERTAWLNGSPLVLPGTQSTDMGSECGACGNPVLGAGLCRECRQAMKDYIADADRRTKEERQ